MGEQGYRTLAHRHYHEVLKEDRTRQLDMLLAEARKSAAPNVEKRLMLAQSRLAAMRVGDWAQEIVDALSLEVLKGFADLGYPASRLDRICFGMLYEQDVTAQVAPFADGSALVMYSDALHGLAHVYANLLMHSMGTMSNSVIEMVRALRRISRPRPRDAALYAGLLRYYNVHQRVFGAAGKLTLELDSERQLYAVDVISKLALQFVLAHEVAHVVLGHATKSRAFNTQDGGPGSRLLLLDDDQQLEFEADDLALTVALRAFGDFGTAQAKRTFPVMGALAAVWAIDATERGLYVRRGRSHPPSELRFERILSRLDKPISAGLLTLTATLEDATRLACDFRTPLPPDHWQTTFSHPKVLKEPHTPKYLTVITQLDTLQSKGTEWLNKKYPPLEGVRNDSLMQGADLVLAGDLRNGLRAWGMPNNEVQRICDASTALSYYALQNAIFESIGSSASAEPTQRRVAALLAAGLVLEHLPTDVAAAGPLG